MPALLTEVSLMNDAGDPAGARITSGLCISFSTRLRSTVVLC